LSTPVRPDQWNRAKELFQEAFELPPEKRAAFLGAACGTDTELRKAVESLLSAHDEADEFLAKPTVSLVGSGATETQAENWIGQRIGSYEILERIGRGGMGVVYRARDVRLGRDAALKVLPKHLAHDRRALSRLQREARAASALNHPNICTVYGIEESGEQLVIAMEMLEGQTLEQRINGAPLVLAELLDIGIAVAEGLDAARAGGFIHRDIKPANIVITPQGVVKILDFGLAKAIAECKTTDSMDTADGVQLTRSGMAIGTVAYMSPEQARGETLDARSDLFSFGAVLYEMATGRPAFAGPSFAVILDGILNRIPERVRKLNPAMPTELERIVNKALEKDREIRYQTATDLRSDLLRLKRYSDSGRIARIVEPARALARRPRFNWVTGLVALAVVLAVILAIAWSSDPVPRVLRTIQITADGLDKLNYQPGGVVTDGVRVYFAEATPGGNTVVAQASAQGHGSDTARLPSPFENTAVLDIAPQLSSLLVADFVQGKSEYSLWLLPMLGSSPRRVGDILAHGAAFTPDAQLIVLLRGDGVFVTKLDGSGVRQIGTLPGNTWDLHVSPDGKRASASVNRGPGTELWEISLASGGTRRLMAGFSDPAAECCGGWTADGRFFIFQTWRESTTNIWAMPDRSGWLRMSRHEPIQLTSGPFDFWRPVTTPDGKRTFVIGDNKRGELLKVDTERGLFSPYLSGISAEGLAFSRDRQWVCWVSYPDGALWRSRMDGSGRMQLTNAPLRVYQPQWSPDGTRIVFMGSTPTTPWKLYLVPADGGVPYQLLKDERQAQADPQWSPDGKGIVYGRWPFADRTHGPVDIRVLDLRNMQVRPVPASQDLWSPRLSPDGRILVALTRDSDMLRLYDPKTSTWGEVTSMSVGFPNWTTDSTAIWFTSTEGKALALYQVNVRSRAVRRVHELDLRLTGSVSRWVGLTPDNSPLVLRNSGSQEIYAIDWTSER